MPCMLGWRHACMLGRCPVCLDGDLYPWMVPCVAYRQLEAEYLKILMRLYLTELMLSLHWCYRYITLTLPIKIQKTSACWSTEDHGFIWTTNTCSENNSTKDVTDLTSESHDVDGRHNHARYLKYWTTDWTTVAWTLWASNNTNVTITGWKLTCWSY